MSWLPLLSTIVLLSLGVSACGGTSEGTDSASPAPTTSSNRATRDTAAKTTGLQPKDSEDRDDDANIDDDSRVMDYGHAASAADARTITALVKRYYTAGAAGDGARICSMLISHIVEAAPEEYGQGPNQTGVGEETCAVVMSKLFERHHQQIAADLATLEVIRVRLQEGKGLVVLRFSTTPEPRVIPIRKERGTWKVKEPLDTGMP